MLERFLAQTWVLVTAFIVGPAFLIWMYRRRWRLEQEAKNGPAAGTRQSDAPKPAARAAASSLPEGVPHAKPLWPGYLEMRWGQQPAEGMTVLHEESDVRFLVRPGDELRIGHVHLSSIVYSFRTDRLEAVIIELPISGFEPLARHLTSEWGAPRSAADRSRHVWADSGSGATASQAVLEKRPENRSGRLVLSSRAAHAERAKTRASD